MFAKNTIHWPRRCLVVIDDFLSDPLEARRWALEQTYYTPDNALGWRSERSRVFPGTMPALRRYFGKQTTVLPSRIYGPNGTVYPSFDRGRRAEMPGVHYDEPEDSYLVLIYLTPNLPADCGTSLWEHKRTGLTRAPVRADEKRLEATCDDLADELKRDTVRRSRWTEIDRVGYRFNRAVVFPAYSLHSATNHHGSTLRNGRLYQLVCIRV